MPINETCRAALHYATAHHLAVLPLRPGQKTPLTAHGSHDATRDPARILASWDAHPRANVGIATGYGLLVIDFDRPDAADELTDRYGPRPATWTTITPKGRHEYFRVPDGLALSNSGSRLLPGVDTRGHGGYVVAPPSQLDTGGTYRWAPGLSLDDLDLAPLPMALVDALRPRTRPTHAAPPPASSGDATPRVAAYLRRLPALRDGEGRANTAFRLAAFALHDCHLSEPDALIALQVWNARNIEPLEDARLARIVSNARRYGGHAA
ncbi:MAG: bifunctional DNA primase/polymerase [Gemmatimonadaceae bacterium]